MKLAAPQYDFGPYQDNFIQCYSIDGNPGGVLTPGSVSMYFLGYHYPDPDGPPFLGGLWMTTTLGVFSQCLINPSGINGFGPTTDNFNDTYTVNGTTVTRGTGGGDTTWSICQWESSDGSLILDYGMTHPYKWSVNGVAKDSNQSAPDAAGGSYGSGTYIVS
jgi:hypothetical protein